MNLYKSNWEGYECSAKFLGKEHVFRVKAGRGRRLSLRNVTAKKFVNMRH